MPAQLPEAKESAKVAPLKSQYTPPVDRSSEITGTLSGTYTTPPLENVDSKSTHASHATRPSNKHDVSDRNPTSVAAPTVTHSTAVADSLLPTSRVTAPDRTTSPTKPTAHRERRRNGKEVRHGMLPLEGQRIGPKQISFSSAHAKTRASPPQVVDTLAATTHPGQEDRPMNAPMVSTPSYAIAQGRQVYFTEQKGTWMAQVVDGWGRVQQLPVVCSPDQTLKQAIEALDSKAPGQHSYCIHNSGDGSASVGTTRGLCGSDGPARWGE